MKLLARLAEEPSRAAILLDVDGVLAPIVPRPEDARVPDELRDELRRLCARYALVACVSGRAGDDTTDLDAFAALEGLEVGVGVAVASPEGPHALRERADIVLRSQHEVVGLLREL